MHIFNLHARIEDSVCMQGIWLGMLGGTVLQTIILVWVTFRTDWNNEVKKKKKRGCICICMKGMSYIVISNQYFLIVG